MSPLRPLPGRVTPAFRALRTLACVHAVVYCSLLVAWLMPGLAGLTFVLGLTHGLLWIALALLTLAACLRHVVPWDVFVYVAILAAVIPLAGAFGYLHEEHRRRSGAARA